MDVGIATFHEAVDAAHNILVITKIGAGEREVSAVIALRSYLTKIGKPNAAVIPGLDAKKFPDAAACGATSRMERMRSLLIEVDLSRVTLHQHAYEERNGKLRLRLTPDHGLLSRTDVSIGTPSEWRFDLTIGISLPMMEVIGPDFELYREFFANVPMIHLPSDPQELSPIIRIV